MKTKIDMNRRLKFERIDREWEAMFPTVRDVQRYHVMRGLGDICENLIPKMLGPRKVQKLTWRERQRFRLARWWRRIKGVLFG